MDEFKLNQSWKPGFLFSKPKLVAMLIDQAFQASHLHTNITLFATLN